MNGDKKDDNLLMDHEYDGIRELDNPLPTWWLITFYAAVIFGFLYWLHYDVALIGLSTKEELRQDLAKIEKLQSEKSHKSADAAHDLQALLTDNEAQSRGKQLFLANCAACHSENGGGGIGPNLTDTFWLNGKGTIADIRRLVAEGVPPKGMPAWEPMLGPEKVLDLTAFVISLKETNVEGGKAPQGERVE